MDDDLLLAWLFLLLDHHFSTIAVEIAIFLYDGCFLRLNRSSRRSAMTNAAAIAIARKRIFDLLLVFKTCC